MNGADHVLPEPYEFLDIVHGETIQLRITSAELGKAPIHPKQVTSRHVWIYMQQNGLTAPPVAGTPITNYVPVLRVHGERLDKASPLTYWDISSKRLIAQLYPMLQMMPPGGLTVTLTANGYKPTKVYSVEQGG